MLLQVTEIVASHDECKMQLRELIVNLHSKGGWPYSWLHLLGFSQGGSACLGAALCFTNSDRWVQLLCWKLNAINAFEHIVSFYFEDLGAASQFPGHWSLASCQVITAPQPQF